MKTTLHLNRDKNILSTFLCLLNIKHTEVYTNKLYNEHPYKYSLYGLSKMLAEYKIQNAGVNISNKDDINALEAPFIAYAGNEFVLVCKKDNKNISYLWQNKQINITLDYFKTIWSGIILLAEPDKESIEPNYFQNRRLEWLKQIKKFLLLTIIGGLLTFSLFSNHILSNLSLMVLTLTNSIGLYMCTLLLMKQIHVQSDHADKICSLFKKSDCNNILESKDAKLWGIISWSEIGFGYFSSNLIVIFWFSHLLTYSVLIGCCCLIFSIWSIWYQKMKVQQWCPLCLIVQLLFWIQFSVYSLFDLLSIPSFINEYIFIIGCIYSIPTLVISLICPKLGLDLRIQNLAQRINSLKMKDEVFLSLLESQEFHKVDITNSKILFGNRQAKIWITILTNPHCEPCGLMHKRVEKLLQENKEQICVQYVFSSFNKDLDISNKYLVAIYLNCPIEKTIEIFDDWFTGGKYQKEVFFQRFPQNLDNVEVEAEFSNHKKWKQESKILATPTILVNGYKLPRDYKIEDIQYFINLEKLNNIIAKP